MIAWSRSAMARSIPFISAIFASRALSPSALAASAFSSRARSRIAARSSAVNPLVAAVLFADVCVLFLAGFLSAIANHLRCVERLPAACGDRGKAFRLVAHGPFDVPDLQQADLALV